VFPDRLRLSALTELETAHGLSWKAPDLDRLVSSCSRLQKLSLRCTSGLQLTAMLPLIDLTQLWLVGDINASTVTSLAALTGLHRLQRLAITDPCASTEHLLVTLTSFTQLTYLVLPHHSFFGSSIQPALRQLCGNPLHHSVDRWPVLHFSVITSTVSDLG